jgi:enhancer of yellow 2 transcription factor
MAAAERPGTSSDVRRDRDEEVRASINAKLEETGEKDQLKELMRDRLVQCGWRDQLKSRCKEIIRAKGLEKVTVEELVEEITPYGRSQVPEELRAEMLQRLRAFLEAAPAQPAR